MRPEPGYARIAREQVATVESARRAPHRRNTDPHDRIAAVAKGSYAVYPKQCEFCVAPVRCGYAKVRLGLFHVYPK